MIFPFSKIEKLLGRSTQNCVDLTDDLVEVQDGQTLVNSRQVAYRFGRRHDHVIVSVEELLVRSPEISGDLFHESQYVDSSNRSYKQYLMNRKGFFMLVSSFKSAAADEWKSRFYDAFESMEKQIADKQSEECKTPKTYVEALRSLLETENLIKNKLCVHPLIGMGLFFCLKIVRILLL